MKQLIKAVTAQEKKRLDDFINEVNQITEVKELHTWRFNELLPKGKKVDSMPLEELKAYLINRKQKKIYKVIEKEVADITTVMNAGTLISVKISVEWKRSRMWGANPTAEAWCSYIGIDGNRNSHYVKSGSIGGCGYDKLSTAVADVLNQFNEVLKPLYTFKNKNIEADNRELIGYGSGYGILPRIEGGVGCSCYPTIFDKIGYNFHSVASGKTFDVYEITKK